MSKFFKHLKEWQEQGLIDYNLINAITDYEKTKSKKSWVLYSIIILGICVISIGLISLVASNWRNIPGWLKLTFDFILLSSIAYGVYYSYIKNKTIMFDSLIVFFILAILATIGLISQVYHTGGYLYQALLLWTTISLPVTLFANKKFAANLWAVSFLTALVLWTVMGFYKNSGYISARVGFLCSYPLFCGLLARLCSFSSYTRKLHGAFVYWAIIMGISVIIAFDSAVTILSYSYHTRSTIEDIKEYINFGSPFYLVLTVFSVSVIILSFFDKNYTKKIKFTIASMAFGYWLLVNSALGITPETPSLRLRFLGPVSLMFLLSLVNIYFSAMNFRKLFSFIILLIGLRFLIIYFQVFGSLAYTGFGLIISGLLIIGSALSWFKYHKIIYKKTGELI